MWFFKKTERSEHYASYVSLCAYVVQNWAQRTLCFLCVSMCLCGSNPICSLLDLGAHIIRIFVFQIPSSEKSTHRKPIAFFTRVIHNWCELNFPHREKYSGLDPVINKTKPLTKSPFHHIVNNYDFLWKITGLFERVFLSPLKHQQTQKLHLHPKHITVNLKIWKNHEWTNWKRAHSTRK